MFDIGMPELVVIFIVALIVLGPKKLPELGRALGKGLGEMKRALQDVKDQVETEFKESSADIKDAVKEVRDAGKQIGADLEDSGRTIDRTLQEAEQDTEGVSGLGGKAPGTRDNDDKKEKETDSASRKKFPYGS